MKLPQEIPENEKSFDGICSEHHPETYDILSITKYFKLDENPPFIYVKSTHSAIRICEPCYLKLSDYEKKALNVETLGIQSDKYADLIHSVSFVTSK